MNPEMNRRSFVKETVLTTAGFALALKASAQNPPPAAAPAAGKLPRGKIGNLEVSRLILGGNLLTHFTHSRDLKYVYNLAARYNTDEKILDTTSVTLHDGARFFTAPAQINPGPLR